MGIKRVTELRKQAKYDEALEMARMDNSNVSDEWTKMSLFWALRDMVKNVLVPAGKIDEAGNMINEMKQLLPDMKDDKGIGAGVLESMLKSIVPNDGGIMEISNISKTEPLKAYEQFISKFDRSGKNLNKHFHEDYGWILYRYMKADAVNLTSVDVRRLLKDYVFLKNVRPSMLHSMMLNFAINFARDNKDFNLYNFYKLWGCNNLRNEDFCKSTFDGHEIRSLIYRMFSLFVESDYGVDFEGVLDELSLDGDKRVFRHRGYLVERFREAFLWCIINHHKAGDNGGVDKYFSLYEKCFLKYKPSKWNSEILKQAVRCMGNDDKSHFVRFFKEWDYNKLREDDWKEEAGSDGKNYPSLASKCARACFEHVKYEVERNADCKSDIEWLYVFYDIVLKKLPDDEWLKREYAMVCRWMGNTDKAVSVYKKLMLTLGDKFYMWSELASCITDNNVLKTGLLLKALRLENNEDFICEVHLGLAECLINEGAYKEASKQLEAYLINRKKHNWSISNEYDNLLKKIDNKEKGRDKFLDFNQCVFDAENFVYDDYDSRVFVLTNKWVNDNVERCSLYDGDCITFQIKSKRFNCLRKAKPGDMFICRYYVKKENRKKTVIPLTCVKSDEEPWSLLPVKYGIIDYVNSEKSKLHILTSESDMIFYKYSNKEFKEGSFVSFREYVRENKNEKIKSVVGLKVCSEEEAVPHFNTRTGVVDDVNEKKCLFHITFGRNMIGDIVKFSSTELRPSVGDFLKATFIIKKNKEGMERIRFIDIQKSDVESYGLKKVIEGRLRVKFKGAHYGTSRVADFAFVDDIYVHHDLLVKYDIRQDCKVKAKAVLSNGGKMKIYEMEVLNGIYYDDNDDSYEDNDDLISDDDLMNDDLMNDDDV